MHCDPGDPLFLVPSVIVLCVSMPTPSYSFSSDTTLNASVTVLHIATSTQLSFNITRCLPCYSCPGAISGSVPVLSLHAVTYRLFCRDILATDSPFSLLFSPESFQSRNCHHDDILVPVNSCQDENLPDSLASVARIHVCRGEKR